MDETHYLESVVIVLLTAVLVVPLFQRFHLSSVLGYLAAGGVIGPHGLGLIADSEGTRALAEFGVIFLLFTVGLELSIDRLWSLRRHIFGQGLAQVTTCGTILGGLAWLAGAPPAAALVIGATLAVSSTAVVLQVLSEQGDLLARVGRISFAVLLFEDLTVAPILALVPLLGSDGEIMPALGFAALKAALAVGAIVLIGRLMLSPVFRLVARSHNREMFAALAALVALGTGWATHYAGLSMALGAFLAGMMLAGTEFRHQVEADIEPFRGVFLGLFFMMVGMTIDPGLLVEQAGFLAAVVAGMLVVKAVVIKVMAAAFGAPLPLAVRLGLLLASGSEFAFVIFGLAMVSGVIPPELGQPLIAAVAITMMLVPLLAAVGKRLSKALEPRHAAEMDGLAGEAHDLHDHVIVAGFGRVGQTVATLLAAHRVPHVCLDTDMGRVEAARRLGSMVFFGNASQPDVLRAAGVGRAMAVVVTLDEPKTAERIVTMLRHHFPDLHILVRAHDTVHARELEMCGATVAVPEALEVSLQLGGALLTALGTSSADVRKRIERLRRAQYALLANIVPPSRPPPGRPDAAEGSEPQDREERIDAGRF